MDRRRSYYAAQVEPAERARLLSPGALVALALLVLVALAAVFPRTTLLKQVQDDAGPDPLVVSYLTNLLKTRPGDGELRLQLATQKLALGDDAGALETLAPLAGTADPDLRRRAQRLELNALSVQIARLPPGARYGTVAGHRVRDLIAALAPLDWSTPELTVLARQARAAGEPRLAADLYRRIIAADPGLPLQWFVRTSDEALGSGDYELAASLLFSAQARAPTLAARREFFLRGLRVLQSGDLLKEALAAADAHGGDLLDDTAVLLYLAQLARAANDAPRAERYARRLLRMGMRQEAAPSLAQRLLDWLVPAAHAAQAQDAASALLRPLPEVPAGMLPYDEKAYTLAWEIFLAGRHLEDAYRVAMSAVRQRPDDPVWRQRLAQVAEWTQRPQLALEQFLALARGGRDEAWAGVLRLAAGLNDDEALLAALKHAAARGDLTARDWRTLAEAFERVARPEEGIAYFAQRYAAHPSAVLLENEAWLAARSGRDAQALDALTRLIANHGATPQRVAEVAVLMVRVTQFKNAYELLERHRDVVRTADAEYWHLLGDLAWLLSRDDTALAAYGALAADGNAGRLQYERLVTLMRAQDPESAARLAEDGWRRTGYRQLLAMAIDIHLNRNDLPALRRLFAAIEPKQEEALSGDLAFVLARARYRVLSEDIAGARADYLRALQLAPGDADVLATYLWFLIDNRRHAELARRLDERAATDEAVLWPPYAAGWTALGEPLRALPYFTRELKRDPANARDVLWLMSYADALEGAGYTGMAWRVRRHAWVALRERHRTVPPDRDQLQAAARLALLGAGGDAQLGAIRRLLAPDAAFAPARPVDAGAPASGVSSVSVPADERTKAALAVQRARPGDAGALATGVLSVSGPADERTKAALAVQRARPGDAGALATGVLSVSGPPDERTKAALLDAATRELVLSWALSGETREAARLWLWKAYGRNLARPGWAEVALAIGERDHDRLDRLLASDVHDAPGDGLETGARIEAAQALGNWVLARTLAVDAQTRAPGSDAAHESLVESAFALANRIEGAMNSFLRGAVKGVDTVAATSRWLTPRLRLDVYLNDIRQWTTNVYSIANVPSHDRQVQVGLLWREGVDPGDGDYTRLRLGWRSAFGDFPVARAERGWRFGGSTLVLGGGWNLFATESVPLTVAGMKRQIDATATVDLSRREYVRAQVFGARYYTQDNAYVGNGYGLNWELGHRVRLDYPDLSVRLAGASQHYNANGQPNAATAVLNPDGTIPGAAFFMPQSFNLVGLYGGFGTSLRDQYTRAVRPFADAGITYNSLSGNGYSMLFGAAGSVFGSDHLQLYWTQVLGGGGTNALVRQFGLRYQVFY